MWSAARDSSSSSSNHVDALDLVPDPDPACPLCSAWKEDALRAVDAAWDALRAAIEDAIVPTKDDFRLSSAYRLSIA